MPTRPIQHQLETESRVTFESLLGSWVYRPKAPDNGIDGEVEIFDENRKASGQQFLVQLKAAEKAAKEPRVSLNIEWIKYYHSLELPVLLVFWVKESGKVFWKWAGEVDLYYAKTGAKSTTVAFDRVWDGGTPARLLRHVEFRRRMKAGTFTRPMTVDIDAPGRPGVQSHLKALCAHVPRLLRYDDEPDIRCSLTKEGLKINFSGHYGTVLHSKKKVDDETVAKRALVGVVISLDYFGANSEAAELWTTLPDLAANVVSVDVAWRVLAILARAGAYGGLRQTLRHLTDRFGRAPLVAPLHQLRFAAPVHRRRELTEFLIGLEEEDLARQTEGEGRSIASYSLGKLWEDIDPKKARRYFSQAIRSSAFYADKAYFWSELGGWLFNRHRFDAALRCYTHAYRKLGETARKSRYGDALMHAGRYADALKVFENIVESTSEADESRAAHVDFADANIKRLALKHVGEVLGIASQRRQTRAAENSIGEVSNVPADELLARCNKAISVDAISNRAWFNRGLALNQQGNEKEAFYSFLVAAAAGTSDDHAWLNCFMLAVKLQERDLAAAVMMYLAHDRSAHFVRHVTQYAQARPEKERAFLMEIAALLASHIPQEGAEAVLRFHGPNGMTVLPVRTG